MPQRTVGRVQLASNKTFTANYDSPNLHREVDRFTEVVLTLAVTAATHTNETYDLYVWTTDGFSKWDIAHFPQIATTGAKTFTARLTSQNQIPANVTNATPGVANNDPSFIQTDTPGANQGIKTLGAGIVRHAPFGEWLGYSLVVAGTAPSITFTLLAALR